MKAMRKIAILIMSLIGFTAPMTAQGVDYDHSYETIKKGLRTDTVYRTDTIHVREIITRDDIVTRKEKVVRYYGNQPFEDEVEIFIPKSKNQVPVIIEAPETNTNVNNKELFPAEPKLGGKFVWVPDSMKEKVDILLDKGEIPTSVLVNELESPVDLSEKVVFRGDTLNMVLKDRNLGRFDRGLFNYLFIPKGIWQVGLTASYGEFSTSDLEILDLISDIDFNGKLWSIRPYFQYFIKSNISVGMRLGFTQGMANIGSFKMEIDEDMSFNLHDIMYKSNSYSASITFSQYLGIARKGRFGVFNEVELALSGGNSDFHRPFNGEMRKTHTTTFKTALNFSPGVCVYVLDQVSFNVSLGVFGLYIQNEKQKVNDEDLGKRTTSGANFRFNIFNINFGIAVNI